MCSVGIRTWVGLFIYQEDRTSKSANFCFPRCGKLEQNWSKMCQKQTAFEAKLFKLPTQIEWRNLNVNFWPIYIFYLFASKYSILSSLSFPG